MITYTDGVLRIERADIEEWAGGPMTEGELRKLADAVPHSSIPQAVEAIVWDGIRTPLSSRER